MRAPSLVDQGKISASSQSFSMAMDDDEDTVMGEAGSRNPPSVASLRWTSNGPGIQSNGQLNGRSDPAIAPPLLGQSMKLPLSVHPGDSRSETTAGADNQGISPPKSLPKSVDSGDATTEDYDKLDSLVEDNSDWTDEDAIARTGLPLASLPSGLCYDVQMRYHCEVRPTADVHPEDPRRIYYIYKELCRAGLVDDPESCRPLVARPLRRINARNATEEEISLVHTPDHFAFVESTKGRALSIILRALNILTASRHVR